MPEQNRDDRGLPAPSGDEIALLEKLAEWDPDTAFEIALALAKRHNSPTLYLVAAKCDVKITRVVLAVSAALAAGHDAILRELPADLELPANIPTESSLRLIDVCDSGTDQPGSVDRILHLLAVLEPDQFNAFIAGRLCACVLQLVASDRVEDSRRVRVELDRWLEDTGIELSLPSYAVLELELARELTGEDWRLPDHIKVVLATGVSRDGNGPAAALSMLTNDDLTRLTHAFASHPNLAQIYAAHCHAARHPETRDWTRTEVTTKRGALYVALFILLLLRVLVILR